MRLDIKPFIKGLGIKDPALKKESFDTLLSMSLFCMLTLGAVAVMLKKNFFCIIAYIVIIVTLLILWLFSRNPKYTQYHKILYMTFCFFLGDLSLPVLYFLGGGIKCGAPLIGILAGVATIILFDNLLMIIMLGLQGVFAGLTFLIDYLNPAFVSSYTDLTISGRTYIDIALSSILVGLSIGIFLRKLTSLLDTNQQKAKELLIQIEDASTKDPLSGAYNRRYLMSYIDSCIKQVKNGEMKAFSLLMFDIDHFKNINDTYGHLAGDDCIKSLVVIMKSTLRSVDVITRYGGEEFICVLPTAEDTPAFRRAEQIRLAVENTQLSEDIEKAVTVSCGVAMYKQGMSTDELIRLVDKNLYIAKELGRNQTVWHEGGIPPLCYAVYDNSLEPVNNKGRRFSDASNLA